MIDYTVDGQRTGADLVLGLTETDGYVAPVSVQLVIAGDSLSGDFVVYPNQTGGYPTLVWPCTLNR